MNSRERVLAAVNHQEPDGVPVDLGATPSSGISAIAYYNLKDYLGLSTGNTRVYDVVQQLAQPEDQILDRFHIDAVDVGRAFNDKDEDWYDVTLPTGTRVQFPAWFRPVEQPNGAWDAFDGDGDRIATMPLGATFFDQTCFPYLEGYPKDYRDLPKHMAKVHWSKLALSPWDHAAESGFWDNLRLRVSELRQKSDRVLILGVGCNLFEWGTFVRRIDNFLIDLAQDHAEVERFLDALLEQHLATLENACRAVGDLVDFIKFGDDLGTDQGPFMSPVTYRKLFKPRHTLMCDYVKQHSQMHTYLHSCGSIYKLLPDLIEAGFEVFNPVQITARDMEPEKLKREFGSQVTFWGAGCDTRHVLNHGTPQEVKDHVRKNIEALSPGGGFVFNTVHNILPDVSPENIIAMYEAVDEYR
jgi:uroporphyrinogen decarboxylase